MKNKGKHSLENIPDPDLIREQYPIEDDSDTLEPFDDRSESRQINSNDQKDLEFWADEFQISVNALQAAIVLNGNSVREIKKFLSV